MNNPLVCPLSELLLEQVLAESSREPAKETRKTRNGAHLKILKYRIVLIYR